MIFILPDVKNRVSVKNNGKISVAWMFLDPIKNRVSVKSVYVEAVYLEALLYSFSNVDKNHKYGTYYQINAYFSWSSLRFKLKLTLTT